MDYSSHFRTIPGDNGRLIDLGPGTPGTVLYDLHAAAVAELAGKRRVHYCWVHTRPVGSFHSQLHRIHSCSDLANDSWHPAGGIDRDLHRILVRASESTRHVAEPIVAATSSRAIDATWISCHDRGRVDYGRIHADRQDGTRWGSNEHLCSNLD